VVQLINMDAVCYAYDCKYSGCNTQNDVFYLVGCYLNPFRAAVDGWGRGLMSYFRMGSRDEKGWEPLV